MVDLLVGLLIGSLIGYLLNDCLIGWLVDGLMRFQWELKITSFFLLKKFLTLESEKMIRLR